MGFRGVSRELISNLVIRISDDLGVTELIKSEIFGQKSKIL